MKYPALLFLLCFAVFLQAQPILTVDTLNRTDSLGKRQGYWKITAAMQKQYGANWNMNSITEEGRYVDSRKQGKWTTYYPNGIVKAEMEYVNNRPAGNFKIFYESGHLQETGYYKNSRYMGEYWLYYETDTLRQHLHFDSLGIRQGTQYYYHPNGKLMLQVDMVNGKENGWMYEYYEDGSLAREVFYDPGGIIAPGKTKEYPAPPGIKLPPKPDKIQYREAPFPRPTIVPPGEYHNGRIINGKEYLYDSSGLLVQIKVYKDGKYVGDAPITAD